VAKLAGVSSGVVSYVLNDGPRPVAAATRRRVLDAVQQLQYRPNASAKALRLNKTNVLGVLLPNIANPFFAEFARELERAAHRKGRSLVIANTDLDHSLEPEQIRSLIDRGIDGLALFGILDKELATQAVDFGITVVSMDSQFKGSSIPTVLVDDFQASKAAVEHLQAHGHRRIGYIGGPTELAVSHERLNGWRAQAGLKLSDGELDMLAYTSVHTRSGGRKAALEILSAATPPTALLVSADIQAIGVLQACRELDISVPEDLGIISFDGTEEAAFSSPSLSSVTIPVEALAQAALDALLTQHELIETVLVPFELTLRESCGCGSRWAANPL
jgi:LacI family transcriptional regulator